MSEYWPHITFFAALEVVVTICVIPWVLMTKRDSTAAMAWCLVVIVVPFLGAFLFGVFGYQRVNRPLHRRRRHRSVFRSGHPPRTREAAHGSRPGDAPDQTWNRLGSLALQVNAFPVSPGNAVTLYHDTQKAFDGLLEAIAAARHHVHLEFFSIHGDATGQRVVDLLTEKVRQGVEVRLLYDAVGGFRLRRRILRPLRDAGARIDTFLPVTLAPFRFRVNLRNHRKITVIDGKVGFTGGMNIGDEYLGKSAYFGYWRDNFLQLEGPAVAALQRIFAEDWDFASGEALNGDAYFPDPLPAGEHVVQVVESGPDQEVNSIRQVYFAAILAARERVWIASPYFVPDLGLLDALRLARYRGVDVRLLTLLKPDHYLSFYASRYYFEDLLNVGGKIYQYAKGMMHSKMLLIDGQWGMVGSANLDNRSLHLNFEVACLLHSPELVAELEKAYRHDLGDAVRLDERTFAARRFLSRLLENACRLLSPTL